MSSVLCNKILEIKNFSEFTTNVKRGNLAHVVNLAPKRNVEKHRMWQVRVNHATLASIRAYLKLMTLLFKKLIAYMLHWKMN